MKESLIVLAGAILVILGVSKTVRFEASSRVLQVGLVRGRHEMPVDDFVFGEIIQENGFAELILVGLRAEGRHWINRNVAGYGAVELYVTGFTPALTAFLLEWRALDLDTPLYLMHYDNNSGDYVAQRW